MRERCIITDSCSESKWRMEAGSVTQHLMEGGQQRRGGGIDRRDGGRLIEMHNKPEKRQEEVGMEGWREE